MTKRAFGELETQILKIMESGDRKTVKDVHQELGGKDNYNTIMTVMSRLAEKKVLERQKMGLQYEYWTTTQENTPSFFKRLKQRFLGVKPTALVSYLVESTDDLTDEDLAEMERIIKKARDQKSVTLT